MNLRHTLFAILALLSAGMVWAQSIPGYPDRIEDYDPREVALLPRYCEHTQLFRNRRGAQVDQAAIDEWYAKLGPTFNHLHHYCWGLMKTNRALLLAPDKSARLSYLNSSISEFDYVIGRAPDDFVLLPEILTKKGENLILLGRGPVGVFELERAIRLKDDYWAPYAQLSDYYKNTGDLRKAREYLEAGLERVPDSKGLRRRLDELASPARNASTKR